MYDRMEIKCIGQFIIPGGGASTPAAANAATSALVRFAGVSVGPPRSELVKFADAAAAPIGEVMVDRRLECRAVDFAAADCDNAAAGCGAVLRGCDPDLVASVAVGVAIGVVKQLSVARLLAGFGVDTGADAAESVLGLLSDTDDTGIGTNDADAGADETCCGEDAGFDLTGIFVAEAEFLTRAS